jgi:hypothetical protein
MISKSAASPSLTDRNVKVWSSTTLAEPHLVAMSADGRYIVAAEDSGDQDVCLLDANQTVKWDFSVVNFTVLGVPLESPYVTWVDISDDGSYVAFGGYHTPSGVGHGFVFLFNQSGLVWYKTDFLYGGGPAVDTDCSGAISGDGSRVAVGYVQTLDGNSSLEVYDDTGALKWGYVVPADTGGELACVSISSDGKYVALGTSYGIYLVHEGTVVWEDHSDYWFWPVRISRDGRYVLGYRAMDNNIVYYNQTGSLVWNQTVDPSVYSWDYDLAISGDGQFAVATGNSTIYFFNNTGLNWTYNTKVVDINQVKISADGYFIVATATWSGSTESDIFHLNRWGKLIWQISQTGDHYYVIPGGALAISANGEYFCSTQYSGYVNNVDRYFSKKYFNYRFVTPDSAPLPINNLNTTWYFSNGTLYDSALTNSSGWITRMFFDPYFVDYDTRAYYWQTKVGQYTLVTASQYESVSDHVASLFDWNVSIHDAGNVSITAIVETYLWNGTLYDNRTANSLRFEDLPNQTYTVKIYYPSARGTSGLAGQQQIPLTQEEQNSTVLTSVVDYHVRCVNHYGEALPNVNVSISVDGYLEYMHAQTNGTGFADFMNILNDTYRIIVYYHGVAVANTTDIVQTQDQTKTVELFQIGDAQPPLIGTPSNTPPQPSPTDTVKISVNVTDDLAGVHDVTLSYRLNTGVQWTNASMSYNSTSMFYEASVPPQTGGTNVTYMITAHDNAGKQSVNDNQTLYFQYVVIPEFSTTAIVLMLCFATAALVILLKRKRNSARVNLMASPSCRASQNRNN